jgi:hypothetical protein
MIRRPATVAAVLISALLGTFVAGVATPAAQAAVNTPVAGAQVSPASVVAGSSSVVSVTATNTGTRGIGQVALGVVSPLGWSNVVQPRNGSCRASTGGLLYCLVNSLGAGKTATLKFTVTPAAAGSYTFNSYARNISSGNETYAAATLVAN